MATSKNNGNAKAAKAPITVATAYAPHLNSNSRPPCGEKITAHKADIKQIDLSHLAGHAGNNSHSHDWFIVVKPALVKAAKKASTLWLKIYSECEHNGQSFEIGITFPTKTGAKKARKFLTEEKNLVKSKNVQCKVDEFLAMRFTSICEELEQAKNQTFIRLKRKERKAAKQYIDAFSNYGSLDLPADLAINAAQLKKDQAAVTHFLRLVINSCEEKRPPDAKETGKPHHVLIKSIQAEVTVDGNKIKLNEPRRAALFLLKILGSDNISTTRFAGLYNKPLVPGKSKAPNCTNIFNQALKGLKEILPKLRIAWAEKPQKRTVLGIKIKSQVADSVLATWVKFRGVNTENVVVTAPTPKDTDRMIESTEDSEGKTVENKTPGSKGVDRLIMALKKTKKVNLTIPAFS